ncbi:hypothetical protein M8J75_006573 [Diaphorina citri]|nr:hypothetical protein M8J75_006573 [Diaphorina citri]
MDSLEAKILKDLGWSDEFMIPVANEENKRLASEIRDLIQKKAELLTKTNDQDLKRKHVKKAIKSAIDSMNQNNELINTLQNQLNSENEMCLSQKNEKDHFESLVKQMKKKTSYLEDRCQMLTFEENKYKSKIEKQKSLIDWAESVLQETNSELDQEDNEDELKRQKLLKDLKQAENILQNEVQELKAKDVEYEQIVKMCRNLNKERNSLIDQWEYSMKILKLRDADICVVEKQIESLEREVGEESLKLEEEKKNHEEELRTNQERAQTRQYYFNQCNGLRASLQQVEKQLFDLKHEKRYLRTHLLELENDKQVHKCHIRNLQAQIKDKSNRLSALQQKREGLKHKLDNIDSEVKTTDETVKQLNSLLKNERNTQSNLIKEIEKLSRHLSAKALETASLRRDLLHKHSCQLESIQKQILNIQGLHSDEFMKAKTRELNVLIDKKKEIEKCWDTARRESKKMDVEIAKTMLQIKKDRNTLAELKDNLTVTKVAVDGKQKLLAQLEDKNQELAVQESLLQLRLQQSKNQMLKHTNQVYSLEKARIEMESSIQARKAEIDSAKSVLLARKRTLQEIRSNLKRSLDHLTVRIEQLKNRYDVIVYNIQGQVYTCVSFTIQNIQDKHVLLEQGNQLESDILKAEKEIIALENTVQVVNTSNISYKSAVFQVEEQNSDLEMDLSKHLDQELCALEEIQSEVSDLTNDIKTLEDNLAWLMDSENQLTKQWNEKDGKVQQLGVELNQQTTKLIRAEKQIKQLKRTLDLIGHEKQALILLAEKDLCTKELIESNESALQQLAELSVRNPETAPIISQYLGEVKLSLPMRHSPATSVLSAPILLI